MTKGRWLLVLTVVLITITGWLWWVTPRQVDMAGYAPAESLVFLEANQPLEVLQAVMATQAWKEFEGIIGPTAGTQTGILQSIVRTTGLGPIESVILSRAQVAAFITELGTAEENETLKIRPEGAILIETHTAAARIRAPFEQGLKALAEKTYGQPSVRRIHLDGVDIVEWSAPGGSRQLVGTIVGSLLIVGNNQRTVLNCVAVSQGRRKSLKDDPELGQVRLRLGAASALTFGYVPTASSARLLAVGLPLLMGRAPGDDQFQRLVAGGAANIFGSLGWTSGAYSNGIEDRYLLTLQPSIVARLKPNFGSPNVKSQLQQVLPGELHSITSYRFTDPSATWDSLRTAVSSQVDALSTIVFASLLKSSLLSYGITDPESFLAAVNGELLTLRLDDTAEHSIFVGGIKDRERLRNVLTSKMGFTKKSSGSQPETFTDTNGEFAASFVGDFIVLGSSAEVKRYSDFKQSNTVLSEGQLKRIRSFGPLSTEANVVTYSDDTNRVRAFVVAILTAKGTHEVPAGRIDEVASGLPFSVTETTLGDQGIERTTRSPLGQFSAALPFIVPTEFQSVRSPESK